jgi:Ca-activated chloride channel homolog
MKQCFFRKILLATLIGCFAINLQAQEYFNDTVDPSFEKTLSPYFFVKGQDGETDTLPLQSTSSEVNISGIIADVVVTQTYKNTGKVPIEAKYIFPASTRAAVYGMKMFIGERVVEAKIKEKEQAKIIYNQAKKEGKSVSLLEQQRPNVFQMNVANIMPEDIIKVELKYTELLIPIKSNYEFIYPTVVGPRYSNKPAKNASDNDLSNNDAWISNPYLKMDNSPTYKFDMKLNLSTAMPIKEIVSDSHKVDVNFLSESQASISLNNSEQFAGNKDFILKYRLAGDEIDSGILLYEGEKENFFLLSVQSPKKVETLSIPPREYLFIIDVSGSMNGFPLNTAKSLLRDLIGNLKPTDRFNVLLFAGDSAVMSESALPANEENLARAIGLIEGQQGMGGTELVPALKRALALTQDDSYSRSIILVTDGYVGVEREAYNLVAKNLGRSNLFSFGIGSSVNRFLIEGLARAGKGEPFVVTRPNKATEIANKFREYITYPALTSVDVKYEGFQVYDYEPKAVPDLFAERPVTVIGKWKGPVTGSIRVHGTTGKGKFEKIIDLTNIKAEKSHSALKYLWARTRITELSDYNKLYSDPERIKQITNLGLTYNLLTDHTSFVAVDHVIRNTTGKSFTRRRI